MKQKTATQQFADFMGISYNDPYIKVFIEKEKKGYKTIKK